MEIKDMVTEPTDGIKFLGLVEDNIFSWFVLVSNFKVRS